MISGLLTLSQIMSVLQQEYLHDKILLAQLNLSLCFDLINFLIFILKHCFLIEIYQFNVVMSLNHKIPVHSDKDIYAAVSLH